MNTETITATRESNGKAIIDVQTQNVDFRNCETIKSSVANVVSEGKRHILLNLTQVSFMDSSGLSVILFCKRTCEEAGGKFGVFGLQSYVNNLVNLTNLNKTIDIFASEAEALG
ncbi:MAG: STAS domain-containing protein [Vampirovibrionales bacterium]|nr:STAS domain-containing protein [Vampirovibrionales bacterium]